MPNHTITTNESDQVYSNTLVPIQVNTNQHESTRISTSPTRARHEPDTGQHESDTSQYEPDMSQHVSTRVRHESTQINTNQHESTRVSWTMKLS